MHKIFSILKCPRVKKSKEENDTSNIEAMKGPSFCLKLMGVPHGNIFPKVTPYIVPKRILRGKR